MVKRGETLLGGLKGDEVCGNSVGLSMYDGPTQTVDYIWANIWCMLNLILSWNCGNKSPMHNVDELLRNAENERLLSLAGMKGVKIPTYCKI